MKVLSRQAIHNLVNRFRLTGLLIDKKQKHNHRVLTEENFDNIGARLEHTPRKSLKRLPQGTGVSKSRRATQLLKLRPYKSTVIHVLQPRDPASRVRFCSWFLQFIVEGEIDRQLTFFSDEAWFHLQGYNETVNCEKYVHVILGQSFPELTEDERLNGWFQQDSAAAHTARVSMQALSDVSRKRIIISDIWAASSPDLDPRDFFFCGCLKDRVHSSNPRTEEPKENISREIANILAEQLERVNQYLLRRCDECLRVE
ncbi:hypothetical protein B7P43_G12868 [Cryptotermes secundus]|uniref:DUF4817 domain-containing protein n=1 Tax=Cryptotermes secundus TaxID=105785 RepID=A0A2J7QP80_9NEOP|nr:hypothetical protein B7P43_G12868 [Cryptotermes secundus]